MSHIKIVSSIEILDNNGITCKIPFKYSFTSVNEILRKEVDIAANATVIIYDPVNWTGYDITKFDVFVMYSDKDLDVEMTINEGDANEELNSFRVVANLPFILGADDAYYNHSASNIYAGTLDVIDKIRVDEPNGTAAKLNIIIID